MSDDTFNILLIGNAAVGKTSLIKKFINNEYDPTSISTIGIEFFQKEIVINNKNYPLKIMDSGGQERYHAILPSYFRNVDGIIFVFDLTNNNSFESLTNWLKMADDNGEFKSILVGNKVDLKGIREVKEEDINKFREKNSLEYFETSSKDGTNVNEIFRRITELLINTELKRKDSIKITRNNNNNNNKDKKNKCC